MKVRRNKLDILFSKMIRERDNWTCQHTGKKADLVDCAHIVSRRHVSTRWHPYNAITLCRASHMFFTDHPFDWADWCQERFGGDFIGELRAVSNQSVNWSKAVREGIYKDYQKVYRGMVEARRQTEQRIDFGPHELMHMFKNVPYGTLENQTAAVG